MSRGARCVRVDHGMTVEVELYVLGFDKLKRETHRLTLKPVSVDIYIINPLCLSVVACAPLLFDSTIELRTLTQLRQTVSHLPS